ncbi:MAG: polysaccharide lyase 6 family protein [Pseudomonadota bacterium]
MRKVLSAVAVAALIVGGCQTVTPAVAAPPAHDGKPLRKIVVSTQDEYKEATKHVVPGDVIVLAPGVWTDFDLVLDAQGTKDHPIYLISETPGEVILSGQSSLRLAGEYLVVSGLVFRDGYTPRNEVISFRRDSENLANNSRITQTVIDNYNNPDRTQRDFWVVMYGKNNEFDHNHLSGKLNSGPTMVVRLNTEESQQNEHKIHYNYFGPRPVFGSNGGETLRIGTSHYSLTRSSTLVENNYFDRCSGEVEIISNKSVGNTYRGNTFFESRGTLTLRHGGETLVENNLFDGNGAPYTGGVRVINPRQTVRNNYFKDLSGERFSGGLVVMNGVPDSPINRYHQVNGAVIENNTFDQVAAIELAEGSDKERSATPINSIFANNIIIGSGDTTPFNLYDDMSGIEFRNNASVHIQPTEISSGFNQSSILNAEEYIPPVDGIGASGDFGVDKEATGVSWYPKASSASPFGGGKTILIQPGENQIAGAMALLNAGDTLELASGTYNEAKIINLQIPITIKAAQSDAKPLITFERRNLFLLSSNGGLRLEGVEVSGEKAPDNVGNSFIASTSRGGSGNHVLEIKNSDFRDFTVNRSFSVVSAAKGTFFDKIKVVRSSFTDLSGSAFKLDAETDDYGIYNIEYLYVSDSTFERVKKTAASVYRGGRDESTFGPHVVFEDVQFIDIGDGEAPLLRLHGVQNLRLERNTGSNAQPVAFTITTGKPKPVLNGNRMLDGRPFLSTTDLR